MEKNTNKFMPKTINFLGLILFAIIYIFLQKIISVSFLLFLIAFMSSYGNSIEILIIPLIIMLIFAYYFGYLSKSFLQKMNKLFVNGMMTVILIYFFCKIFIQTEFVAGRTEVYIFCTLSHISYIIGVFFSDKIKKILGSIKFKRK